MADLSRSVSFWRYYRTVAREANKEATWARDNLAVAFLLAALVGLIAYFVYRQSPEWTGVIATCWVFGVALLVYAVVILCRAAWRMHLRQEEKIQAVSQAGSAVTDPFLLLMQRREALEAELVPLEQIEECGIKIIPVLRIAGKDEGDFRREKIERLKRDIEAISKELEKRQKEQNLVALQTTRLQREDEEQNEKWKQDAKARLDDMVKSRILQILREHGAIVGANGLRLSDIEKENEFKDDTYRCLGLLAEENPPRVHLWKDRWYLGPPPTNLFSN